MNDAVRGRTIDAKGVAAYLAIVFGITWTVEGALIACGVRFNDPHLLSPAIAAVGAVMFAPAIGAFVTMKWISREGFAIARIRFGSWRPYLGAALVIPAAYVAIYGLTWLLGIASPDWEMRAFKAFMVASGADSAKAPAPSVLPWVYVFTLVLSPILNMPACYGEELGWRGYLLPKLMPLGKLRAYLLTGFVWGLWHAPLVVVGFGYPGRNPVVAALMFIALISAFNIYICEMTVRHRSSILAGWIHAVFNAQAYGVLYVLLWDVDPVLGGKTGLIAVAVWSVVGWLALRWVRQPPATAKSELRTR
jgi:hypothetical protein